MPALISGAVGDVDIHVWSSSGWLGRNGRAKALRGREPAAQEFWKVWGTSPSSPRGEIFLELGCCSILG
jgi:hypothetical protein